MNRREMILGTLGAVVGSQLPAVEIRQRSANLATREGFNWYSDGTRERMTNKQFKDFCAELRKSLREPG